MISKKLFREFVQRDRTPCAYKITNFVIDVFDFGLSPIREVAIF